jgi:bifunctional non-homologous end joining protein LigD
LLACYRRQNRPCITAITRSDWVRSFNEHTCPLGVVSKRADPPYAPGNRGLWLKVKCLNREGFVVIGWTDPEGARPYLCALLLGYSSRVHWIRPDLVAEVKFLTWTDDNLLRQLVDEGLREDKPAARCAVRCHIP